VGATHFKVGRDHFLRFQPCSHPESLREWPHERPGEWVAQFRARDSRRKTVAAQRTRVQQRAGSILPGWSAPLASVGPCNAHTGEGHSPLLVVLEGQGWWSGLRHL